MERKPLEDLVRKEEREFGEESVGDDDEDARDDDGLGGGAADALRAATNGEALVTTDSSEDEAEGERLHQPLHEIAEFERVDGARPKFDGAEAKGKNGSSATAEQADEIGEASEERLHENGSEDARRNKFSARVGAHGAHGVDLFGDEHGAELGSDARGAAARHEDAR